MERTDDRRSWQGAFCTWDRDDGHPGARARELSRDGERVVLRAIVDDHPPLGRDRLRVDRCREPDEVLRLAADWCDERVREPSTHDTASSSTGRVASGR